MTYIIVIIIYIFYQLAKEESRAKTHLFNLLKENNKDLFIIMQKKQEQRAILEDGLLLNYYCKLN